MAFGHLVRAARAAQREAILDGLDWFMDAQYERITQRLVRVDEIIRDRDPGPYLGEHDCEQEVRV